MSSSRNGVLVRREPSNDDNLEEDVPRNPLPRLNLSSSLSSLSSNGRSSSSSHRARQTRSARSPADGRPPTRARRPHPALCRRPRPPVRRTRGAQPEATRIALKVHPSLCSVGKGWGRRGAEGLSLATGHATPTVARGAQPPRLGLSLLLTFAICSAYNQAESSSTCLLW
jgi:hypothetical protein